MRRVLNRRNAPVLLAAVLLGAFLAISPVVGALLRWGSPPPRPCKNLSNEDIALAQKLWRAYDRERDGLIDDAETDYAEAAKAKCPELHAYAVTALQRLRHARESNGLAFTGLMALAAASAHMRAPLIGAAAVILSAWLLQHLLRRRGARLKEFTVHGCTDRSAGAAFAAALLEYSNLIRRVYESDYARQLGIQLFFDDFKGAAVTDAGPIEQALAEARDLDVKAAVGLALGQAILFLREMPERPRLLISGTVRFFPGSARGSVTIRDLVTNIETHVDASSMDASALPMLNFIQQKLLAPPAAAASPWLRGEDLRRVSGELHAVALVLACKIRWRESRTVRVGFRPSRWETICLTTAAIKDFA